jgi:hypothetical protein
MHRNRQIRARPAILKRALNESADTAQKRERRAPVSFISQS